MTPVLVNFARLLDSKTGKVRKTVSTGRTNKTCAAEWTVNYLAEERERRQREAEDAEKRAELESQITVADIADGFWEISAPYARGRRACGYSISCGYLEACESYTRNHIIPEWGDRPVTSITAGLCLKNAVYSPIIGITL